MLLFGKLSFSVLSEASSHKFPERVDVRSVKGHNNLFLQL